MSAFADVATPRLSCPGPPAEFENPLELFDAVMNAFSPTYWVNEVINHVFGFDPLQSLAEGLAGDWQGFAVSSEAFRQAGEAIDAVGRNIAAGNGTLDRTWDGHAADAAYLYFAGAAEAIRGQKQTFDELADGMMQAAQGCAQQASAIANFAQGIIDALILAAVEVAAGSALAWTGIGAVVGYSLAALEITRMLRLFDQATSALVAAENIMNGLLGLFNQVVGGSGDVTYVPPPSGGYDHPGV